MAELSTVARPYAQAIFDIAKTQNSFESWSAWLVEAANIAALDETRLLILDPKLTADLVFQTFCDAMGMDSQETGRDTDQRREFLKSLIEQNRLQLLPEILTLFQLYKNAFEKAADAIVELAFPTDSNLIDELMHRLQSRFGKLLKPKIVINPKLIGGVKVTVGDVVWDESVLAKLDALDHSLSNLA